MKQKLLICLIILSAGAHSAWSQNSWKLDKDNDGIKVYTRASGHSKFNDLRVETTLKCGLSDLAAVLLDIPSYPDWSFNCKTSKVLKQVSPSELYLYTEINSPWPAKNRDLPIHLRITQDPKTKVMTVKVDCVPDFIPPKKDVVRIPLSKEIWIVKPLDRNTIHIEYELEVDPGEGAPAWLVNMFSVKGPYETFVKLKDRVALPKYQHKTLPFIVN